jgi:hypothetical protein
MDDPDLAAARKFAMDRARLRNALRSAFSRPDGESRVEFRVVVRNHFAELARSLRIRVGK